VVDPQDLVTATIWMEAEGEPFEAKLGVAETIRNRAAQHYLSDGTMLGTVLWPLSFSGWNAHGSRRIRALGVPDTDPVMVECLTAWEQARAGSGLLPGVLNFYSVDIQAPDWATDDRFIAQYGRIKFFTR
jgi:spore germination cell wall hydrolase CwlJ-like protein